ncbi:Bud site selection protein, Revert to axial protein 1 [Mortierella sp. GBA30]|nr:Bud site selection protein, Revert to axial protein 1 [Mortierella sp. GBA30]
MSAKHPAANSPLFSTSFFSSPSTSSSPNPNVKPPSNSNKAALTTDMTNLTSSSLNDLASSSLSAISSVSHTKIHHLLGANPTAMTQTGAVSNSAAVATVDEDDMDEDRDEIEKSGRQQQQLLQHGYSEPHLIATTTGPTVVEINDGPQDLAQMQSQEQQQEQQQEQVHAPPFQTIPLSPLREKVSIRNDSNQDQQHQQQHQQHQRHHSLQMCSTVPINSVPQQRASFSDANIYNTTTSTAVNPRNSVRVNSNRNKSSLSMGHNSKLDPTYSTSTDDVRTQQLPNLWQVLHRKTLPPMCLFNFYLYMRDYEKSSEEVDFWLDVTAHEVLWKLYVRATKRRMAMAAQERAEREEREREAKRLLESQMEQREQEEEKKSHRQQASINLDMYEPHWSAANRYLELSSQDESSNDYSNNNIPSISISAQKAPMSPNENTSNLNLQHKGAEHLKHTQEFLFDDAISSKASPMPSPTIGRVQLVHLPGAVPDNWNHPYASKMDQPTTTAAAKTAQASSTSSLSAGEGPSQGIAIHRVGTNTTIGTQSTGTSTLMRRGLTAATAGVTKDDLVRSAERIYYKYLTPQAERPVRIPGAVRHRVALFMDSMVLTSGSGANSAVERRRGVNVTGTSVGTGAGARSGAAGGPSTFSSATGAASATEVAAGQKRKNTLNNSSTSLSGSKNEKSEKPTLIQPDQDLGLVFAEARDMVFEGMESYYFPRFIKARAYGNLCHKNRIFRVVLGLCILFIGFTSMFITIFLNIRPRSVRAWQSMIPIFIGIMLCTTFQFNLCPIMAAFGVSETKWMQYTKIKEPFILLLHRKRAIKVVVVAVLYTLC